MAGCPGFMGHEDGGRQGQRRIVGTRGHRNWDASQTAARKDGTGGMDRRARMLSHLGRNSQPRCSSAS